MRCTHAIQHNAGQANRTTSAWMPSCNCPWNWHDSMFHVSWFSLRLLSVGSRVPLLERWVSHGSASFIKHRFK